MSEYVFKIKDKTGRKIHLSKKQWSHISKCHTYMCVYLDTIKATIQQPLVITESINDKNVKYYYSYYKNISKYLLVVVKYLNGSGFVITSLLVRNIK